MSLVLFWCNTNEVTLDGAKDPNIPSSAAAAGSVTCYIEPNVLVKQIRDSDEELEKGLKVSSSTITFQSHLTIMSKVQSDWEHSPRVLNWTFSEISTTSTWAWKTGLFLFIFAGFARWMNPYHHWCWCVRDTDFLFRYNVVLIYDAWSMCPVLFPM